MLIDARDNYRTVKQIRASRGTSAQCEDLVTYMENHSQFAAGKFVTKEGRLHYNEQWETVTTMLNSLPNGIQKSTKQWQTVWRDLKSNSSRHASKIRQARNETGNVPINIPPLNPLEQRIIGIMGLEYVEGTAECPDSMPEQGELQVQLEAGNSDVLLLPPKSTSIITDGYNPNEKEYIETPATETITTASLNETTPGPSCARSSKQKMGCKQQHPFQCTTGRRRQRVDKLFDVQERFVQIAEKNAAAQQMLAEAALLTARNEERRIEVQERRIINEEKLANILETPTFVVDKLADGFR